MAHTGGLADTVIDASPAGLRSGAATGLQVHPVTADALSRAFDKAGRPLQAARSVAEDARKNAMRASVGWDDSAAEYKALYDGLNAS